MNGLKEIQECIKNFICEKVQVQQQIAKIEEKRIQLAQQRNEKKKSNSNWSEINELGNQIANLGNQSQELQNRLDFKTHEIKSQINLAIDNLIAGGIRGIRRINEEIQELEENIADQKERNEKYQIQKQEFYERFGRMPELSENAIKDSELQEEKSTKNAELITELNIQIKNSEDEITELARIKRELKNGNWKGIAEPEDSSEELRIEPITVEEIDPIEEISVEEFLPLEELYVEEFEPVEELHIEELKPAEDLHVEELHIEEFEPAEELHIEEFEPAEELHIEEFEPAEELYVEKFKDETQIKEEPIAETVETAEEKTTIDEIEELARAIVEQIAAEQTRDLNINKTEETVPVQDVVETITEETEPEDIIAFEDESKNKEKVIIPLFGQREKILNITVKIEDGELVYKAQMSDGEEVKIHPAQIGEENVLLRDKQNREECKEILINYSVSEFKMFDKKVIKKIDPLVCELLTECAERYGYSASELIYDYAMSFSYTVESDIELVPEIVYNISYLEQSNLSKKEKAIINKICKNAKKNNKVEIIETFSGFKRIKYVFKRLFTANNVNALPEGKY